VDTGNLELPRIAWPSKRGSRPDELLLKLALVVALGAMPSNTLELSGEVSVGDVIEIETGSHSQWLAGDPFTWRPIAEPSHLSGVSDS